MVDNGGLIGTDPAAVAATPPRRRPWREWRQWRRWLAGLVGSRYDGMDHFSIVQRGVLMRCGQPRERDLAFIRDKHGLRTVVCARGGTRHPLRGRWFRRQRRWCEQHGVRLVHWPFSDGSAPPQEIFDQFVALCKDPASHPVLVHCEQGFHRTGVLAAAFRVGVEGWPIGEALSEMERLGFERDDQRRIRLREALLRWYAARSGHSPMPAPSRHEGPGALADNVE